MAGQTFYNYGYTSPAWRGDGQQELTLIAGGARVDPSEFSADSSGKKYIPSGTLVGRTYAERDANTGFGLADVVTPDDEIYLLANDVLDADLEADCTLYRHGSLVKENFLPDWGTLTTGEKDKVRELYTCITGAD